MNLLLSLKNLHERIRFHIVIGGVLNERFVFQMATQVVMLCD